MKKLLLLGLIILTVGLNFSRAQGSGRSIALNGTNSYVNCGTINLTANALTLMGWVKVNQFNAGTPPPGANITSLWGEENGAPTLMRFGDGPALAYNKVQFVVSNGRTTYKLNGTTALSAGRWYHIAGVFDGVTMKIYVDGILEASKSQAGSVSTNTTFQIGQNYNPARTINGEIDEVSVWKAALSQSTIRNYMCKSINSSHPNYSALEAYWKFDETTGSSVTDHSSNSYTGTLISSPTRQFSSAPIGDESANNYGSPSSIYLSHPNGDSIRVSNILGSPTGVHLYRVDKKSNATSFPKSSAVRDTTRYWGVHYVDGFNPTGTINYYFLKNSFYVQNSSCFVDLLKRANNSVRTWSSGSASQNANSLALTRESPAEYLLTFASNKEIHPDTSRSLCIGDSIELKSSTNGFNYQWYKDGNALLNDTSNALKVHQAGAYFLTLSSSNCTDTSSSFSLSINQKPVVSLNSFSPICYTTNYYNLGGGNPSGGVYINPNVSGPLFVTENAGSGEHKITYRYTDSTGCSDTASKILKIHPLPKVSLPTFSAICVDSSSFTLNTGLPAGGQYLINGNLGSSFDATAAGVGTQIISYIVVDSNNCTDTARQNIEVLPLPQVSFRFPNSTVCENADLFPISGNNPSGGIFTGTGVSGFNFNPKVSGVGDFAVTYNYTDRSTGCSNIAFDTMHVKALPAPPTISQVGRELVASNGDSYQWYDKDGPLPGETKKIYKPTRSGVYRASVTIGGCTSEVSIETEFDKTLHVEGHSATDVLAYPIPCSDVLQIKGKGIASVKLLDLNGKIIASEVGSETEDETKINTEHVATGSYLLKVEFVNGQVIRKKIIKQ